MNIFHGTTIFNRDRKRRLEKYLYELYYTINNLNNSKLEYEEYLTTLDPSQTNKIQRIQWRIQLTINRINRTQSIVTTILNFLNDKDGHFVNIDTLPPDNSLANDYIFNPHNFGKLTKPSFAPTYPVRLSDG